MSASDAETKRCPNCTDGQRTTTTTQTGADGKTYPAMARVTCWTCSGSNRVPA